MTPAVPVTFATVGAAGAALQATLALADAAAASTLAPAGGVGTATLAPVVDAAPLPQAPCGLADGMAVTDGAVLRFAPNAPGDGVVGFMFTPFAPGVDVVLYKVTPFAPADDAGATVAPVVEAAAVLAVTFALPDDAIPDAYDAPVIQVADMPIARKSV